MKAAVEELDLLEAVELLRFVAGLATCEEALVSTALARFDAAELRSEALCQADRLAQAMGFPDADMDPTKAWPRRPR